MPPKEFRSATIAFTTALLLATASGCSGGAAERKATTPGGGLAPEFSAVDLQGVPFRLSDHRGKIVLINFFASWCAPCVIEMPHLRKIYEANKDKGFLLVVISLDGVDSRADMRAFSMRSGLNVPVILDDDLHISALYNPKKSAPLSILIDRAGEIVVVRDGFVPGDEATIAEDVASALRAKPRASNSSPLGL